MCLTEVWGFSKPGFLELGEAEPKKCGFENAG